MRLLCPPGCRINNAGTNAYKYGPLLESDDEDLEAIVDTNVLGVMLCCKEVGAEAVQCFFWIPFHNVLEGGCRWVVRGLPKLRVRCAGGCQYAVRQVTCGDRLNEA